MHFDPITGEKIMDPGDEIQEQVNQAAGQATQAADQAAQAAGQFQGQATQAADQAAQAAGQFQGQAAQAAGQFQQAQGQFQQPQFQGQPLPMGDDGNIVKKGLPIGAVIGIVAAVVVVLGAIVFFATRSMGAKVSLLTLGATAYEGNYLNDAFKEVGIKPFEDATVTVDGEVEDVAFNFSVARRQSDHTSSVYAEITYSGFTLDATGYIDEKKIKATCPVLYDDVFVYDYSNNKNDGYFAELLDYEDIDVEEFNTMIAFANDNSDLSKKFYEKTLDYYKDIIGKIDFKKTGEKETFNVNGKDITCKEYKAVITEDTFTEWIEGYQDLCEDFVKDNSDEIEVFEDITGEDLDFEDAFEDMLDDIEDMDDIEISVFTKGTTVAAIYLVSDDEPIKIFFKGGDYLAQNLEIEFDGDTILTVEGKTNGDVQTSTITFEEEDYSIEYSYNRKTGALTIESDDLDFVFEGTIVCKKGEVKVTVDSLEVEEEDIDIDTLEITVSNKADIKEPKGDEFDLGKADEDDFEDLYDEIYDNIMDNDDLYDFIEELSYMF